MIPFTTVTNIIKYLGINLINEVKYLNNENYKTFFERKKKPHKWRYLIFMD